MTFVKQILSTALPYHQQDNDADCGVACAQMLIHSLNLAAEPLAAINQEFLSSNRKSTQDTGVIVWSTAPDSLHELLNGFAPAGTTLFGLATFLDEPSATHTIIDRLDQPGPPPVALVFGFYHWVLVTGFTASSEPSPNSDLTAILQSLDIYNPYPAIPAFERNASGGFDHNDAADGCGSGNDRGVFPNNVSYAEWQSRYMKGVPCGINSLWQGLYLVVCQGAVTSGPAPCASGPPASVPTAVPGGGSGPPASLEPTAPPAGDLLTPDEARDYASRGVRNAGLPARAHWMPLLEGAAPSTPYLVENNDQPGSFYYIVPFVSASGVPLAVRINAHTGAYLEAGGAGAAAAPAPPGSSINSTPGPVSDYPAPEPDKRVAIVLRNRDQVRDEIAGKDYMIQGQKAHIPDAQHITDADLPLVWQPCPASLSPLFPLYRYAVASAGRWLFLYIRAHDGRVFTDLNKTPDNAEYTGAACNPGYNTRRCNPMTSLKKQENLSTQAINQSVLDATVAATGAPAATSPGDQPNPATTTLTPEQTEAPDVVFFIGLLGQSPLTANGFVRLYLTVQMNDYIEFSDDDVWAYKGAGDPLASTMVWLRKGAIIKHYHVDTIELQRGFLQGDISTNVSALPGLDGLPVAGRGGGAGTFNCGGGSNGPWCGGGSNGPWCGGGSNGPWCGGGSNGPWCGGGSNGPWCQ